MALKKVKKYLKRDLTLVRITEYCQNYFGNKLSGKTFTHSDIEGYIRRGKLPDWLGGQKIALNEKFLEEYKIKVYDIYEETEVFDENEI